MKVMEDGNCTRWSELHIDFLESIFKRVGVIEYLMCACVCKSWRSVAIGFKQKFMASQGPLLFLMPRPAGNHCYLYDMFDKRLYRAALSHLAWHRCLGFTCGCGYLVLSGPREDRAIWLVNPFTRHELEFPSPTHCYRRVILASLGNSDQEFLVVAFSMVFPYLQFCRSGDVNWKVFEYVEKTCSPIDVVVFKGKIYALSNDREIWTVNLNSDPKLTRQRMTNVIACIYCNLHLVASHEELYLAHAHPAEDFIEIHKLDFERMKSEEVKLQGEVLFLGYRKCCGLRFPTPSCSRVCEHMNQVWYLRCYPEEDITGHHTAPYFSERSKCRMLAIPEDWKPPKIFRSPIWYFPHLSSTVDSVNED